MKVSLGFTFFVVCHGLYYVFSGDYLDFFLIVLLWRINEKLLSRLADFGCYHGGGVWMNLLKKEKL